jgi:transposase InsO family protein
LSVATFYRWKKEPEDRRKGSRRSPSHKLSEEERQEILDISCSDEFKDSNPYEIVAILLERGTYIASARTFYRVLKAEGKLQHRSNRKAPQRRTKPPERKATGPDQVYTWDITYLPTRVRGMFFYAYIIMDVWTREIVGWAIHTAESEEYARQLFLQIKRRKNLKGVYLHSDNGNPMKASSFSVWLISLGMILSYSRPLVKNDNPFSEALFGTLKRSAGFPRAFASIEAAREWLASFAVWYNNSHRHSGIGYVTPVQRRTGESTKLFEKRNDTLDRAWKEKPERFPKKGPKYWKEKRVVYLNHSQYEENQVYGTAEKSA